MIVWREKLIATAIHFLVTLALAACAAALIFLIWFPDPMQKMLGGTELFVLVVGCDLALGPLISLVIYNSRKSRRELVTDYTIVGTVQLAALAYGIFILAGTRPVYVAFSADRFEIVTARDISKPELAAASAPQYRSLPWTGPRFVAIAVPDAQHDDALFQSLAGNEEHMRPRFYVKYESELKNILAHAKTVEELTGKHPGIKPQFDAAIAGMKIPASRVRWLPVHHRTGFWTALIDTADGKPVAYVNFDPY